MNVPMSVQPQPMNAANPVVFVDLAFSLRGAAVPLDHGYPLFAALSRVVPRLHEETGWGVHPIHGNRTAPGRLELLETSRVKLRIPAAEIAALLPLAGATLDVAGAALHLGAPTVLALRPGPDLLARIVIIKGASEPGPVREHALRQLAAIPGVPHDVALEVGPRRVLRVGEHTVVGFQLAVTGLDTAASLAVQCRGLGGRRHMGAGLFVPPGRRR